MKKFLRLSIILSIPLLITVIRLYMFVPVKVINGNNTTIQYLTLKEFKDNINQNITCIGCHIYEIDITKYRIEALITFVICFTISIIIYIMITKILRKRQKNTELETQVEQKIK